MLRTLVPLALIVFVLVGAWLIWPRADPRTRVEGPLAVTGAQEDPSHTPATTVEIAAPETERAQAEPPATEVAAATTTRLLVRCVERSDQRALAGVRVHANEAKRQGYRIGQGRASHGKSGEELVSDAEGRVEFEVEPGVALVVNAGDPEHFVSLEQVEVPALAAGEARELQLEHEAGEHAHFCGLVVAREDGRPLANSEVRVNDKPRTSSDASGRFELDYAAHLAPALRVDAKGFGPALVVAGVGHESADRARRIELERAGALVIALQLPPGQAAARVVLNANGSQISQDEVFTTNFSIKDLKWDANADAQGVCSFEELPAGVRFVAQVIGSSGVLFHAAEPIVLKPGETKHLAWDLRGCELVGHVYEADGKPAPHVTLWLLRGEPGYRRYIESYQTRDMVGRATSSDDGSFRFASVSPGTWVLAPQPARLEPGATPADAIASVPLEVTIRDGETQSRIDVQLARGLYIRGTLVAPEGTQGVGGYVRASSSSGFIPVNTDAHGVFAIGPLAPGVFRLEGTPYNTFLSSLPVEIEAGTKDVVLRSRPGAEVAGKVIDAQSGAGVQAAITIGNDGGSMTMTRTQPDGSFRLDGLAPGRYTLFASTNAGDAGELAGVELDTRAPLEGLQIVLQPGATLRIRYEGSGGGQVNVRRNGANIGGDGLEGGRSLTQVVPRGKVAVEFHHPGVEEPEVQELELGAGEAREVVFKARASK